MDNKDTTKTVVAEDIEIVGTVKSASNIQMDGKLNGDLNCLGNAIIGNSAIVKGNIIVNCATVFGQVNGNITAKDKIELKSSANVNGDIRAKRMTVEDGVTFVGKSEVNPSSTASARAYASAEIRTSSLEIAPQEEQTERLPEDSAEVTALKEEIRKNVKEEVKSKTTGSGGFFGKR